MDAEIKEFGFILCFALFLGFGYFSISLDDLAFTQPAPPYRYLTAESFDVPELRTDIGLVLQNGVPLSWVDVYWEDQEDPPNMFGLQQAYAAEFYLTPTEKTAVRQEGDVGLATCPSISGPSSATFVGAVHGAKARTISGDIFGCTYGILSFDILLPLELEKDLALSTSSFYWAFDWIPGSSQWNAADNIPSSTCHIEALSGANGTGIDARLNATAGYDGIFSNPANLDLTAGFCDRDNDERSAIKDARPLMDTDFILRDNKTFYQVGTYIGVKTSGRDTIVQTVPTPLAFLKYNFPILANNTSLYWQMQEHPMFAGTFPAITDGSMQNVTNVFQLDTGDVNSEVGQVIIFKAFNTTDLGILGDIRVVGEFQSIGTTAGMQLHIEVKDGNIQAGQTEDRPITLPSYPLHQVGVFRDNQRMLDIGLFDGPFDTKSSLNVNNSLSVIDIIADTAGVIQPFDISFTPFWAGSSDVVTVMVGLQDNSATGRMVMNITSIEIEDEVKYDFGSINDLLFLEPNCSTNMASTITKFNEVDLNKQHLRNCGLDNSNGLVALNTVALSGVTGLPNPTPAAVTGLLVTFIGDIANLTWNHPQTNVTSFQIERDTGDGFKTIHYVSQNKLTTLDRTSLDLSGADTDLLGLPRSTSITYRVTPLNGAISGVADTDTKTSNTISDEWQWREYNDVATIAVNQTLVVNQTVGAEKRLEMKFHTSIANRQGDAWLFKVFPIAFINNTQIEVDWEGILNPGFTGGFLNGEIHIYDGVINRFNTTQFNVKVGGVAGQTLPFELFDFDSVDFEGLPFTGPLPRETKIVAAGDPNWGASTSELITLVVRYNDGGGKEGSMKVASIKVGDAFYNFSNPTIILEEQDAVGELTQNKLTLDFEIKDPETQQDTGLVIPSSANVTISIPINFQVIQDMALEAELDWSDALGADNYEVFRNGTLIGSPILSEFTDTTLGLGTHFLYKVRAINTQVGSPSGNSTIIDFGLIDPIGGLSVTALNSTAIQIDWDLATTSHPTDAITGIQITRNGTLLTTVDDLIISFNDTGLIPETHYQYVLKPISTNSTGISSSQIMPFRIGANYESGTTNALGSSCPVVANPTTVSLEDLVNRRIILAPSNSVLNCSRNSFEFVTSEISVGSTITNVTFRYTVSSASTPVAPRSCTYNSLELQPSITNHQDRWDDVANGTLFITNNDCNTVAVDFTISTASMVTDLQANVDAGEDWWGLGQKFTSEVRSTSNPFNSRINSPELQVEYTGGSGAGATTLAISLPDQVTGLVITQEMNNNATLDWDDAALADNYQVLRKTNFTTSSQVNANATWQFREFQNNNNPAFEGVCATNNFGTGSTGSVRINSADQGGAISSTCDLWKTFPRDFLNNTRIQFKYQHEHISSSSGQSADAIVSTRNEPDVPDRADDSDWGNTGKERDWESGPDVVNVIGSQSLTINGGVIQDDIIDLQVDWDEVDTDYVSVIFRLSDSNSGGNLPQLKIFWMNVTDFDTGLQKAFYNFSEGAETNERTAGNCDGTAPNSDCAYGVYNVGSLFVIDSVFEEIGTPITSDFEDSTISLQGVSTYKVRGNSTTSGFGLNSTDVDFGLIQQIDGVRGNDIDGFSGSLNATALNSTAIKLTWDLAITEHPTDLLTGVIIQRSNDTNHNIINGTWQFREYNDAGGDTPNCVFTQSAPTDSLFIANTGTSTNSGFCNIFKILPTHLINNTKVFVDWESQIVAANSGSVKLGYSNSAVFRDPDSVNSFPIIAGLNAVQPAVMISGKPVGFVIGTELTKSLSSGFARTIDVYTPTFTSANSGNGYSTLYVELNDFDFLNNPNIVIHSINITDTLDNELMFWNFTDLRPSGSVFNSEVTTNFFAHGTIDVTQATTVSNDLDFRFDDTNISFDSTGGIFETITTVDDLDTMFTDQVLQDDLTFVYRLKGQSAVSTGAFGLNISAATTPSLLPGKPFDTNATAIQRDVLLRWTLAGENATQSNTTNIEIKRDGLTIATGLANQFSGVFSEDFNSFASNVTADLIWTHNNCNIGSPDGFCGVNATDGKIIVNQTSNASDGITYDVLANNGFQLTDANGNGDFTLLFDLDYKGASTAAANYFIGVGNETGLELPTKDTDYLGIRTTISTGFVAQSYSVLMSDNEDRSISGVDFAININTPVPQKIYYNMTFVSDSKTLFTTTYSDSERTIPTGTNPRINTQALETYNNLRFILLTPFDFGSGTIYDVWEIDNIQLFVNGTVPTSYLDLNPGLNTLFNYTVIPSNSAGDGPESDAAFVTTNDFPNIPTGFNATAISSQIDLEWVIPSDYGEGSPSTGIIPEEIVIFKENTTDTAGFFLLDTVSSSVTSISDLVVDASKNYTYKIAGQNSIGLSANTTDVIVLTAIIPDQVTGLVITQEMNNNATLNWDNATGADNYQVLRKDNYTIGSITANATWQFREQRIESSAGVPPTCAFANSGQALQISSGIGESDCYVFKTFPRQFLNNSRVQFNFEYTHTGSPSGLINSFRYSTQDSPNAYNRNDIGPPLWTLDTVAPFSATTVDDVLTQSITSGQGHFNSGRQTISNNILTTDSFVDTEFASIVITFTDGNPLTQNPDFFIYWINVTDATTGDLRGFYNFTNNIIASEPETCANVVGDGGGPRCIRGTINAGSLTQGDFVVVGNSTTSDFIDSTLSIPNPTIYKVRGNGTGGFGLNSTEVDFGLIQPIQNLNATALNSTAIKLTWDLANTVHQSDPLTGVIIQRLSPESIVYACSVCSSTGVEVGPLPNKVYGQRITLNQTETIDKIVNTQRWFNGAVTGGFIDVFIAHPNGTIIQSSVEVKSAVTIGIGNQDLDERTYTFSPSVTLVAGVYDFMTRWNGIGFTNAVTGKTAGDPNAGVRVLDQNNNFNDGYTPVTVAGEDTTIFLNTTGFVTIITVDELDVMFTDSGLTENTNFTYRAKGQSAVSTGAFGTNDTATTLTGVTVNAPTGFAGIANTTDITLSWNNQTDKETWTLSRNGTDIITGLTVLSFQDVGVPLDANLGYILTAINGTATNSTSEIVIKSNDIPSVVTGVGAMPINGVAILVEWDDPVADDGEGSPTTGLNVLYDIFRRDVGLGDPFSFLTTVAEGTALFNDTTVLGGHTFSYQLSSRNEVGSATNSTEASAMVDNALIIRALESDGVTDLNGDVSIRVFNSTFTSTKIGDGQGRASFPTLSGIYNFTIFHIPTDFLINKTVTSIVVTPINDVVIDVTTQVHRVNCASNGPADDFIVLVNSTSPDHFISDFTSPVCDVDDKVSWDVLFEGFQGAAVGGGGGGPTTAKETPIFSLIGEDGAIDPVSDLASGDFFLGQLFDLSGQMPIGTSFSVEKIIVSVLDTNANDGNYTGVILNNVTQGGFVGDNIAVATAETVDISTFPINNGDIPFVVVFNFTTPVDITLDGTDFIGIQVEGATQSNLNTFLFADMGQVEGTCMVSEGLGALDFWEPDCSIFGAGDDFAMEIVISDTANLFNTTGGIASDKLVVHQTFDIAQLSNIAGFTSSNVDLAKNKTLSNAGTFGSDADFTSYFTRGLNSTDAINFNLTGLLGESWIKDSKDSFIIGSESNKKQFDFLHDGSVNTWSVNFWLQQDGVNAFSSLLGTNPFLSGIGSFESDGMVIHTTGDKLGLLLVQNDSSKIGSNQLITAGIPNDTDWHMVTVLMNFTNTTNSATVCLDNACEVLTNDGISPIATSLGSAETALYLAEPDIELAGFPDREILQGYSMDELCIWKDHYLTPTQRTTLFNSGNGALCGTVSASVGGGGGGGTSSFTTQMKTLVLSLGDFGNNAKNFIINGTVLPTTFGTPIITSDPIVVSTSTSNVLLNFDELFLQSQAPPITPPPITPTPPPVTPPPGGGGVPSLSTEDQQTFFEDLFGFSLFSKIHQMSVGQIQDGTIDITWNSPSNIVIEGIEVGDQFITWIGFPRTPFTLDGSDRISTGKIPYRIMPPNQLCDEVTGQTINCVDRILYEIPVTIHATVDGQPLEANTVIKVNLSLDITLALFTIFIMFAAGVGAIIYRAVIVHPRQKRKESKKFTTRSKERGRIEQRFTAKKSKLRRRP